MKTIINESQKLIIKEKVLNYLYVIIVKRLKCLSLSNDMHQYQRDNKGVRVKIPILSQ